MPSTTLKRSPIPDARLATLAAGAPFVIAAEQRRAAEWRALIETEWSGLLMTLTAAAHWIATAGAPIDPDDDALEAGAMRLLGLILTGVLKVFGRRGGNGEMEAVPFVTLADATQGSVFFAELPPGARPRLVWAMIMGDGHDVIATRDGVLWGDLSVMKADLIAAMEPEPVAPAAKPKSTPAWETELKARIAADPSYQVRVAIKEMKQFASDADETIPTVEKIKAARKRLKGIEGPEKRGPKGPRKRP